MAAVCLWQTCLCSGVLPEPDSLAAAATAAAVAAVAAAAAALTLGVVSRGGGGCGTTLVAAAAAAVAAELSGSVHTGGSGGMMLLVSQHEEYSKATLLFVAEAVVLTSPHCACTWGPAPPFAVPSCAELGLEDVLRADAPRMHRCRITRTPAAKPASAQGDKPRGALALPSFAQPASPRRSPSRRRHASTSPGSIFDGSPKRAASR